MATLLSIIKRESPGAIQVVQEGLEPVRATGRSQSSINTIERSSGEDIIVTIRGHNDMRGVIFGLEPGESRPNVSLLQAWIAARSLRFDADKLADRIEEQGTRRQDFGFYEATERDILRIYDDMFNQKATTDAVFSKIDQQIKNG